MVARGLPEHSLAAHGSAAPNRSGTYLARPREVSSKTCSELQLRCWPLLVANQALDIEVESAVCRHVTKSGDVAVLAATVALAVDGNCSGDVSAHSVPEVLRSKLSAASGSASGCECTYVRIVKDTSACPSHADTRTFGTF